MDNKKQLTAKHTQYLLEPIMPTKSDKKYRYAVVIQRCQIYHKGHEKLTQKALEVADEVLFVIGSSYQARSAKDPFTASERSSMVSSTLSESERDRITFLPVRDYYDNSLWVRDVNTQVSGQCNPGDSIALIRLKKMDSSSYQDNFPRWTIETIESDFNVDTAFIRRLYFEVNDADVAVTLMSVYVSPSVSQYLKEWRSLPEYQLIAAEHAQIERDKKTHGNRPSMGVNALVTCNGYVLLGKRKNHPGQGLWTIPGGYLGNKESLLACAMRKLKKETLLNIADEELKKSLVDSKLFSDPERSSRGREISQIYHFYLGDHILPSVAETDDLASVNWVSLEKIPDMESLFFGDHFSAICSLALPGYLVQHTPKNAAQAVVFLNKNN